jgi:hypothetical protein
MKSSEETKNKIHKAIRVGYSEYYSDWDKREKYLREWKNSGYKGECKRVQKLIDNSIIEYMCEEVMKVLEEV